MDIEAVKNARWVLLPGTLCTETVFDGFLDVLSVPATHRQTHRLTTPNIDDYRDFFQNDIRAGDIICGFSLGAIVAAHHADVLHPDATLLLFGINPHADDPAKAAGRRALQTDVQALGGQGALAQRLPPLRGPNPGAARRQILYMADQAANDVAAQTSLALSRPGALPALRAASARVMAFAGACDDQAAPRFAAEVAAAAPNGRFATIPDLGHYALIEDPAACAAALISLMELA